MNKKLVSIITPTYNSIRYIEDTYKSIKEQTYENWEWLITDDCSTDETWHYLQEISKAEQRIRIFKNTSNSGAAVSRNNSIKQAVGEYIAFLDSDDIWLPKKLELHIEFMERQNIDLSFTTYTLINEDGLSLNKAIDMACEGSYSYADMLKKKATMGCCTVVVRKSAFSDISMPLVRAGQDFALWLKLLKTGTKAVIYKRPLSKYRIVSNSLSRNKYKKALKMWHIYKNVEQLGYFKASYVFCHYAIRALFKLNESDC